MKKNPFAAMIRKLETEKKRLAERRDALREIESEAGSLAEDAKDALDSLEYAIDALSRQV